MGNSNTNNNERIIWANRGLGYATAAEEGNELSQIDLNLFDNSEPMYANNVLATEEMWIGDRTNNIIFIYDTLRYKRQAIIDGCKGIFHNSYNVQRKQWWLTCDIDKTVIVYNVIKRKKIKTIVISNIGEFQPHDIFSTGDFTYVTLLKPGDNTAPGFIIQYSTKFPFKEVNRIIVGGDPHVFATSNALYVASQATSQLFKVDLITLRIIDILNIPNAHGVWGGVNGNFLYVTNIAQPTGKEALYAINLNTFTIIDNKGFDTADRNPHNIIINNDVTKLFITHTAAGTVSAYDIIHGRPLNGRIIFNQTGSVPFGIMNGIDGECIKEQTMKINKPRIHHHTKHHHKKYKHKKHHYLWH